jgi:hypothetical protein
MKTITDLKEIQVFIFMLESLKDTKYTDFNRLRGDLEKEFNINVSIQDINKIYEPTFEEDQADLEIYYKNLFNV